MAYYVNPPSESKEEFLLRVGVEVPSTTKVSDVTADKRLVVWMDNKFFSAAAILPEDDQDLVEGFQSPGDRRLKKYFVVPLAELENVVTPADWERMTRE